MPEGDTIHRAAHQTRALLEGRLIDELCLRDRGSIDALVGKRVVAVGAHGKHLLVEIEGGWTLRVHLGMRGRWRRVRPGAARPASAVVWLRAGHASFVCTGAYQAELIPAARLRAHGRLARLGADVLAPAPDIDAMVERAMIGAHRRREIGDVLLDQTIAAGIGNVYKSEVLFLGRVHPRTKMEAIDAATVRALYDRASKLMRANLHTPKRVTVPARTRIASGSRFYVYRRNEKPCLVCETAIERIVQGDQARSTYFCPRCQTIRGCQIVQG
jgi:endonuclease-8